MLLGRDFDRAIYGLRLTDEVLHARFYKHFIEWCNENMKILPDISQLMTAADIRVGDADVSGRSKGGVTTPLSTGDTRPVWVDVHTDVRV